MKKEILFIAIILSMISISHAQTWQWANQIGGNFYDRGMCMVTDNNGNVYFGGGFQGSACYFNTDTLTKNDSTDYFLVKYDISGNEQWIERTGDAQCTNCNASAGIQGIAYDSVNNYIYICGTFNGTSVLGNDTLTSTGLYNMFLAKYDVNGNCIWAKRAGGGWRTQATGVAVDLSGNVYVCGESNNTTTTFDAITIQPGGFIAKYDSSGNCLWAQKKFRPVTTGYNEMGATDLKVYNSNIIIAGGAVNDTLIVDTVTIYPYVNPVTALIAGFDTSGMALWIKTFGGPWVTNSSYDFSMDGSGNIYVGGAFTDTGYFGIDTLTSDSTHDAFLVKYDINGNYQWVRQAHATVQARGYNVSSDANGFVYAVGYFAGDASFGIYNVTSVSWDDVYLTRYSSNGTCLGVTTFANAGAFQASGNGIGVTQDVNGNPCIAGVFAAPLTIGSFNFTSHGYDDIFIAKLDAIVGEEDAPRLSNSNQLLIYANPTTGKCTVSVPQDFLNESNLVLSIFDSKGSLIQRTTLEMNDGKIKLNIEAQARGMYNITLSNGQKSYNGRIVFE